jgi:hypothetical protein
MFWSLKFDEPIALPDGGKLVFFATRLTTSQRFRRK